MDKWNGIVEWNTGTQIVCTEPSPRACAVTTRPTTAQRCLYLWTHLRLSLGRPMAVSGSVDSPIVIESDNCSSQSFPVKVVPGQKFR